MDPQAAFRLLQPLSVNVAKEGTEASVRQLTQELERILDIEKKADGGDGWTSCLNDLKEYLIFPLLLILKKEKSSWALQEVTVKCLWVILQNAIVDDFNFFNHNFTQLFLILSDQKDPQKLANVSEECKQLSLTTVSTLTRNCTQDVLHKLYGNSFKPQLGHAIYMCLKLVQEEKNRNIKIEAMKSLSALGLMGKFDTLSQTEQASLSLTYASFLPGIVIALTKIATGDEKQGHKVTSIAIDTWSYFVSLVMRDDFLECHTTGLGQNASVASLRKRLFGDQEPDEKKKLMKEIHEKEKKSGNGNKFHLPEPDEVSPLRLPEMKITDEWVAGTVEKLMLLIQSLTKLVTHSHWRVRLSLVQWAQHLIGKSSRSLVGAVMMAIEVIITLRSDDVVDVGLAAQDALIAAVRTLGQDDNQFQGREGLLELVEERVYALSTHLPTKYRQYDDVKSLASTRQLLGCLEVLGERIDKLLTWPSHSLRLLRALSFALTLDTTDSDLLLEKNPAQDPLELLDLKPSLGRCFKYFRDTRILECLASTCKLIGYHSNLTIITDLCLDLLQETTMHQKETLLLLTLIIQGRDRRKWKEKDKNNIPNEENEDNVRSMLDVVMCPEIFNVNLCASNKAAETNENSDCMSSLVPVNNQKNVSVDMVKNNIVLLSNALNLISACAQMMGSGFEMFLSSVLCSVMEKAGEANVLVCHSANNTLKEIAVACGYQSVSRLIEKSVPHFWYPLSMRLKRLPQYPSAPLVLKVSLELANLDVMAFTEELVEDVLTSLDAFHTEQAIPLVRVLLVYVTAVVKYESKNSDGKSDSHGDSCLKKDDNLVKHNCSITERSAVEKSDSCDKVGEVAHFLMGYHKDQTTVKQGIKEKDADEDHCMQEGFHKKGNVDQSDIREDGDDDEVMGDDAFKEEEKKKVPRYIALVVAILERCSHMLYVNDRKLKLLIMEIIKAGTESLMNWENERLPVLYKLWKPLVLRLKDTDFVVMMRALEVLSVMVVSSSEFLQRRTMKEVFPPLMNFLRTQRKSSLGKSKKSGYYMTPAYRAQYILLEKLHVLVRSLTLTVIDVSEILSVVIPYLSKDQPIELCSSAMSLVKNISNSHPHHVWLALAYQHPPVRIMPPAPTLTTITIPGMPSGVLLTEATVLYQRLS